MKWKEERGGEEEKRERWRRRKKREVEKKKEERRRKKREAKEGKYGTDLKVPGSIPGFDTKNWLTSEDQ